MYRQLLAAAALAIVASPAQAATGTISGKVKAQGGTGRPWVVYVEKGPEGASGPGTHREMMQKNSQFEPGAVWVRAGDSLEFVNRDNIYHNVFSPTKGTEFDLGLYRGGIKKIVEMQKPGEVDVYCNIHPQMHAKVLVTPKGQAVEAAEDGSYAMEKLAPGTYTLVAWSATHEPVLKTLEVKGGAAVQADFALKLRGADGPHLNKNGEQYGRYK